MSVTYGGDKITFEDGSSISSGYTHFRNRFINGAMEIDQRNAGASVTLSGGSSSYTLDRYRFWVNGGSGSGASYTVVQSSVVPTGFSKSMLVTQTGSATPTGDNYNIFAQYIEGLNVADLGWGTASAATITLSFWIRSSITGTFGGALSNSAQNRSYPFSYTISSSNTWEQKSITIPGDTTGTWLSTNGIGFCVFFDLGTGSTYRGPANSWAGTAYLGTTGTSNWVGTNGSTLYVTGFQLERGSYATTFERRPYGTELQLCQRYYEKSYAIGTVPGTGTSSGQMQGIRGNGMFVSRVIFKVTKRTTPGTIVAYSSTTGTSGKVNNANSGSDENASINDSSDGGMQVQGTTVSTTDAYRYHWTADAEL